ncbi:MAG: RluA family pseudouridine synthase [Lachnospiraceae bacterium]|nr:RluA family pseudouridine synthase [Lachnospiraceae bacterium]
MQSVTIGSNQAGQRLDKFLHKYLPNAGDGFIYKMLRKKNITLNGKKALGGELLSPGDTVESFFSEETFKRFSGSCSKIDHASQKAFSSLKDIEVLYEDEFIIALNKPAGILTQKASESDLSLNEWLLGYLLNKGAVTERELMTFHPSVCNRLDRNTSGIVLCGKSLKGSQLLSNLIKEHALRKFYRTICVGEIREDIVLEGYLTKASESNKVFIMQSTEYAASGNNNYSYIKTAFRPIKVFDGYTYLEAELFTGRTHQIRAQLAGIGHPVIGDFKYGAFKINNSMRTAFALKAQLLHACRVEFPLNMPDKYADTFSHMSGMKITAPIPLQFEKILDAI